MELAPAAVEVCSLNRWTSREVPESSLYILDTSPWLDMRLEISSPNLKYIFIPFTGFFAHGEG